MKSIGIIGGMGPLASADLFKKIILLTKASRDSEHIHVFIDSNTSIPDRTQAILHGGESPVKELTKSALKLEMMGADIIVMACNTAHYFYDEIKKYLSVMPLNMIELTAEEIQRRGITKVGLLATSGTCESKVYDNILEKYGISIIKPSCEEQKYVMDLIYSGVKAGNYQYNISDFLNVIKKLKEQGSQLLILGCTELPIAFNMFDIDELNLDPTSILAKGAIEFALKDL